MILTYDKVDFRLVQRIERQPCDTERRDISCMGFFLFAKGVERILTLIICLSNAKKRRRKNGRPFTKKKLFFAVEGGAKFFLGLCIINASEERERTLPERTLCIFLRKKEKSFEIKASK